MRPTSWSSTPSASLTITCLGLLKTANGRPWYGDNSHGGRYYRTGSKSIGMRDVDAAMLEKVAADLRSREFSARIVQRVRANADREHLTEAAKLRTQAAAIPERISRFMDMASNLATPGPVLRKIDELERQRLKIEKEINGLQEEARIARAAKAITEDQVAELLADFAADVARYDRERLKDFLDKLITSVVLEPKGVTLRLHWKIKLGTRNKLASPRGFEPRLPP